MLHQTLERFVQGLEVTQFYHVNNQDKAWLTYIFVKSTDRFISTIKYFRFKTK